MTDAVMTVREVADLFRVSPSTIYKAIELGQIPAVRLVGTVRIPTSVALTLAHASDIASAAAPSLVPADVDGAAANGVAGDAVVSRRATAPATPSPNDREVPC